MMTYAAFMMGLLGSLHCLGMCGPIAFALPVRTTNKWEKLLKYLLYNMGRVLTYSMMGLLIGFAGKGFAMAGLQQILSIGTGLLIICSVLFIHVSVKNKILKNITNGVRGKLKSAFRYYFQKSGMFSLVILGVLNGLLPCGMVYMAMLGALATGSYLSGAIFMAAFGIGTLPLMLSVSLMGNMISEKMKSLFYKSTPIIACIVGTLLIMRGLNLEIPYVSPSHSCCHAHNCH
jgi:uncharacterized protein